MQEKPTINENTDEILENAIDRRKLPLFSPERYKYEVDNYRLKKEAARSKKNMEDLQKLLDEEEEIRLHSIHKGNKKLDINQFYAKYSTSIRKYEQRKRERELQRDNPETMSRTSKSPATRSDISGDR